MLVAVGLLVLAGDAILAKLIGDNVCQEEKRYTINVTEYFLRNSTVRNYKWCLNVPPRCSFYTTKLINDSRIVENEVTESIDKCCSGYTEDKDSNKCTPVCPDCLNGTCVEGKCSCFPGFKGDRCDIGCESSEWGQNCKFQCECGDLGCHPETGRCRCPPGQTGNNCHLPCPSGFHGSGCQHRCSCDLDSSCDPQTGQCGFATSPAAPPTPTIYFTNNGKFEPDKTGLLSTTTDGMTETPFPLFEDEELKIGQMPVNNYMSGDGIHASTTGPVQITKSKAKVRGKEVSEENYLSDDPFRGNPEVDHDLVNSASAATAISGGIIIVAALIVAVNHFKKNRKKGREGKRSKGVSTVAVYTHSIFHTPLPDPPTFENPIFVSPVETSPANEGRFETHVVCSMNFPAHTNAKDPRDYLYDHPPSTGSYRAASIPEPPDIPVIAALSEPLYDEIPSGVAPTPISQPPPSYKSSSVYMNTCGKTRF